MKKYPKIQFQDALDKAGFSHVLKYEKTTRNENKNHNRRRPAIWFNPPFSANVSTNEYKRHRPAPRPWAAPLVPFLAAPRVGRAAVWASVPFGTYQVAGSSQMG